MTMKRMLVLVFSGLFHFATGSKVDISRGRYGVLLNRNKGLSGIHFLKLPYNVANLCISLVNDVGIKTKNVQIMAKL